MVLSIGEITNFVEVFLSELGFGREDVGHILENILEAELSNKKTHGLISLIPLAEEVRRGEVNLGPFRRLALVSETVVSLVFDGGQRTGYTVYPKSLQRAVAKTKGIGVVCVALRNFSYSSGYLGAYAKMAVQNGLIFISFNKSPRGLVPKGAVRDLIGTNPITIGIPCGDRPVILDMALSKKSWNFLLQKAVDTQRLPAGVAVDPAGEKTVDAREAMKGGLLPMGGHKGTALAIVSELLGGVIAQSMGGYQPQRGWGAFYLLIDPKIIDKKISVEEKVEVAIEKLRVKAEGFKLPGERSRLAFQFNEKKGQIEISERLWRKLQLLNL